MAVADTFFRRLEIALSRYPGAAVRLLSKTTTGCIAAVPIDVRLKAGAEAIKLPITDDAGASPLDTWALLVSSSPGVVARLEQAGTSSSVRGSGLIASSQDDVTTVAEQDGTVTPSFVTGTWLNHSYAGAETAGYDQIQCSSEDDDNFSHKVIQTQLDAAPSTVGKTRYILGAADYLDLGAENDGKLFQMLIKADKTNMLSATIKFYSVPYGDLVLDDVGGGTPSDWALVTNDPGVPNFSLDIAGKLVTDRWTLVTMRKGEFTANVHGSKGRPLWSRITAVGIGWQHSTSNQEIHRIAGILFADPAEAKLDARMALLTYKPPANAPVVLSLDAPSSGVATVEGIVVVR